MNGIDSLRTYIKHGKNVAIWGVDNSIISVLNELADDGISPSIIIDGNPYLWGKKLFDIRIMSYDEGEKCYPDLYFYVMGGVHRFEIIGNLVSEKRVSPEKIINYERVEKRWGCKYICNYCLQLYEGFGFCCGDFGKNKSPRSAYSLNCDKDVVEWLMLRDELGRDIKLGKTVLCGDCCEIKESWYPAEPKLRLINYSEGGGCNYNCMYCTSPARNTPPSNTMAKDFVDTVLACERAGILSDDLHIDFSPGEPTLHKNKKKYFDFLKGKYDAFVMTNASYYDEELAECIRGGKCTLCVSVDAGTPETYAKVKGYDFYERVKKNLKLYGDLKRGIVELKYIFVPDVNDDEDNVRGFVNLCKEVNPGFVFISYDIFNPIQTLPEKTYSAVRLMIDLLDAEGMIWKNVSNVIAETLNKTMK